MKKNTLLFYAGMVATLFFGCDEPRDWRDVADSVAPGQVGNVNVENINGGALITYTLPNGDDLLGVKAVYSLSGEGKSEVFSSAFRDTLQLSGFVGTEERIIQLFTVDKSRNESLPVEVKVKPLQAPIELIRRSLAAIPTFGGVYATWENPWEDELAVSLYKQDSVGEYVLHDTYYTKDQSGAFSFRGLAAEAQNIRLQLRDRWNHYSRPLDTVLTPIFEEEIIGGNDSGDIWQRYGWADGTVSFRGDLNTDPRQTQSFPVLFDGVTTAVGQYFNSSSTAMRLDRWIDWPDDQHYVAPMYLTIDMGKQAAYSRLRYWVRPRQPLFSAPIFTVFEVWATNNPKPLAEIGDGSQRANLRYWTSWAEVGGTDEWKNDWVKILDAEVKLPSGQTDANLLSNEDKEFVARGFEFEIDPQFSEQSFRYLRFVIKKTNFANNPLSFHWAELKFWGRYAE